MNEQNYKGNNLDIAVEIMNNILDIFVMEAKEHNTLQGETVKVEEQITRRVKEQNYKEDYLEMAVVLTEISKMPMEIINHVLDIVVMEAEEQKTQQGQTVKVEEVQGDQGQG